MITRSPATRCDHCAYSYDTIYSVRNSPAIVHGDALHLCEACLDILGDAQKSDPMPGEKRLPPRADDIAAMICGVEPAPTAEEVVAAVRETLRCQARTTPAGKALVEAGGSDAMQAFIESTARNVAQYVLSLLPEVE